MKRLHIALSFAIAAGLSVPAAAQRNVVIFVADGLRYDSVTPETAPTLAKVRREGVDFTNTHAAVPTLTTVNGAVIATGHYPGDTGNYGNSFYTGTPVSCASRIPIIFVEDNCNLRSLKKHFPDGYLNQTTLVEAAHNAGMNTVLVGKGGPLAIQFLPALDSTNQSVDTGLGVFLDGPSKDGPALHGPLADEIRHATGVSEPPATSAPNLTLQAYQISAVTQVLIPRLKDSGKPFVLLFWSRDPDITQHAATDSDGQLLPGINNTSTRTAIYNADSTLRAILDSLQRWGMADNTDIIVTADHGFSTVAKSVPPAPEAFSSGFVARDIAKWLNAKTFDTSRSNALVDLADGSFPYPGNALIGPSPDKPQALVVANGGVDFVYVPEGPAQRSTVEHLIAKLAETNYAGALFVNDRLIAGHRKAFAGALPMSDIGLMGSSKIPAPSIVVGFRSFAVNGCSLGKLMCTAAVFDTGLHVGQGAHGSLSRADTRNFMAAIGPDFKTNAKIDTPVGNVDVAPTAAHLLGLQLKGAGTLKGRVIAEALKGGEKPKATQRRLTSMRAKNGVATVLDIQETEGVRYIDAAGIVDRTAGLR